MMTFEEMIAVLQAFKEGKEIQYKLQRDEKSEWLEGYHPDALAFNFGFYDYRVKPEPEIIPWTVDDWREFKNINIMLSDNGQCISESWNADGIFLKTMFGKFIHFERYSVLAKEFKTKDGMPCGKIKE